MRRSSVLSIGLALLWLSGCGGGEGFERTPVSGLLTLDGKPVAWGDIYFKAEAPASDSEVVQAWLEARHGRFESAGELGSPGLGANVVTIRIYQGEAPAAPDSADMEPVVKGYWQGRTTVAAGTPLVFELRQSELSREAPE